MWINSSGQQSIENRHPYREFSRMPIACVCVLRSMLRSSCHYVCAPAGTLHMCACACVYVWIRNGWLWVWHSTKLKYHAPIQRFNQCGTRHHTAAHSLTHMQTQFSVLWCVLLTYRFCACVCASIHVIQLDFDISVMPTDAKHFSISFKIYNVYIAYSFLCRFDVLIKKTFNTKMPRILFHCPIILFFFFLLRIRRKMHFVLFPRSKWKILRNFSIFFHRFNSMTHRHPHSRTFENQRFRELSRSVL